MVGDSSLTRTTLCALVAQLCLLTSAQRSATHGCRRSNGLLTPYVPVIVFLQMMGSCGCQTLALPQQQSRWCRRAPSACAWCAAAASQQVGHVAWVFVGQACMDTVLVAAPRRRLRLREPCMLRAANWHTAMPMAHLSIGPHAEEQQTCTSTSHVQGWQPSSSLGTQRSPKSWQPISLARGMLPMCVPLLLCSYPRTCY